MALICAEGEGYLYYVSYAGVTGADRLDTGVASSRLHAIRAQAKVPVHPSDTPQMLADRVLAVEHKLYPEALTLLASGKVKLENGLAVFR